MNKFDIDMLEAHGTYFRRLSADMRAECSGVRKSFNVLPLSSGFAANTADYIQQAVNELRRLGVGSKGNG
jgi:hypothetical protein